MYKEYKGRDSCLVALRNDNILSVAILIKGSKYLD